MKKILSSGLLIIITAALLFSCKKDISKIGVDIVGENPLEVIYMDTATVRVYSELIDSLRTDELSAHVVGVIKDPVFGTLNASVYSQFNIDPGNESYSFGDSPEIDSVVLYIAYANVDLYGDTSFRHEWVVYELGDEITGDSAYYSFQNTRLKQEPIAYTSFIPNYDSVEFIEENTVDDTYDTSMILNPVKIYLSNEFGERVITSDSTVFEDDGTLSEVFKGIYITTLEQNLPSSGGSLVDLDFQSDDTFIRFYYHNEEEDSLSYDLVVNYNTARFSNFNHYEYRDASPEFRSQVINGHTEEGEELIYLQGLAGVRTVIEFPYLSKIDDYYNYAVNEAKLFIYNQDTESGYTPISSLTLSQKVVIDSVEYQYTVPDASSGDNYFSGKYDQTEHRYFFRITQYIQDVIQGYTEDSKLRVEIIGGAVHPNRLIGYGHDPMMDESKRVKLQIIYTKIDSDEEEE